MINQFELKILDAIQSISNPVLDAFFTFITYLGDEGIIWIIAAVVMLFFKKSRKCGIMVAMALIIGLIVGNLGLKNIFARPRPFTVNSDMLKYLLVSPPNSYSFPSGHTMSSVECAVAIFLFNKKWGIPALILASLIGFSRCYLYVHYPTDVLAGALLGIAIGFAVYFIYNRFIENKVKIGKFEL